MLAYAEHIGAEIIVSAGRYKNPNSIEKSREIESKEKNKTIWAPEVRDYLYASRIDLNSMLTVLCDVKIQYPASFASYHSGLFIKFSSRLSSFFINSFFLADKSA